MFAGPNGSGKSTLKDVISADRLGVYINPDDLERQVRQTGVLDFSEYRLQLSRSEVLPFFTGSELLAKVDRLGLVDRLEVTGNRLHVAPEDADSYFASVLCDLIRRRLLAQRTSFTFETVMSSPDKVRLLHNAQRLGFRTYLYYVATEDPAINISRVRNRVSLGGHNVPADKIISRYARSLDLLLAAIRYSNRAYLFDNSGEGEERMWIAEVTEGVELEFKTVLIPNWFHRAVLEKVAPSSEPVPAELAKPQKRAPRPKAQVPKPPTSKKAVVSKSGPSTHPKVNSGKERKK